MQDIESESNSEVTVPNPTREETMKNEKELIAQRNAKSIYQKILNARHLEMLPRKNKNYNTKPKWNSRSKDWTPIVFEMPHQSIDNGWFRNYPSEPDRSFVTPSKETQSTLKNLSNKSSNSQKKIFQNPAKNVKNKNALRKSGQNISNYVYPKLQNKKKTRNVNLVRGSTTSRHEGTFESLNQSDIKYKKRRTRAERITLKKEESYRAENKNANHGHRKMHLFTLKEKKLLENIKLLSHIEEKVNIILEYIYIRLQSLYKKCIVLGLEMDI